MTSATNFLQAQKTFQHFQAVFEKFLHEAYDRFAFQNENFQQACRYALEAGGKRFRPILVLLIAESSGGLSAKEAALCVEFFHTASLIIDDLPSMDNDETRRGAPTTHRVYGEGPAVLATYALISEAFDCLRRNTEFARENNHPYAKDYDLAAMSLGNVCKNLGILGLTGGQYLDLYSKSPSAKEVEEVLRMKTGALFETSFYLGWLFGGGDPRLLPEIEALANHFGMAFQIADDIDDLKRDLELGREMNLAVCLGKEKAKAEFEKHLQKALALQEKLPLKGPYLQQLCDYLYYKGNQE